MVGVAGRTAIMLTKQAWCTACLVSKVSNNAALSAVGNRIIAEVTQPGFMKALANAARAVVAVSELLRSEAAARQLAGPTFEVVTFSAATDMLLADTASAVGLYVKGMTDALSSLLCGPRAAASRPKVPNEATQIVEALVESELFAAAAATLVDSPNAFASAGLSASGLQEVCQEMRTACGSLAGAVGQLALLRDELASCRGQEGARLAAGLWRMGQHGAVRRLQVALLDQLAAEAGMGARLEEAGQEPEEAEVGQERPEENAQQQQQEEAEAEAGGWGGSSGTWWFAKEEAERGQLLGMESGRGRGRGGSPPERDRCEQESYHCEVMGATIGWWYGTEPDLVAGAGVPAARPPPLLAARLTARATEALCRLYQGKGLDGGYGPEPTCMFALHKVKRPCMAPMETATVTRFALVALPPCNAHGPSKRGHPLGWQRRRTDDANRATAADSSPCSANPLPAAACGAPACRDRQRDCVSCGRGAGLPAVLAGGGGVAGGPQFRSHGSRHRASGHLPPQGTSAELHRAAGD